MLKVQPHRATSMQSGAKMTYKGERLEKWFTNDTRILAKALCLNIPLVLLKILLNSMCVSCTNSLLTTTIVQTDTLLYSSCCYILDSLKQLRVMYLAQEYFDSSSSFMLFHPLGCGGGINRFKGRWKEFCCEISATHAHIYHNQRIFLRLKNWLFLSLFPRANLTYAWCRFGANNILDYNEVVAVWSFSSAVLIKWIPYGSSNTI